MTAQVDEMTVEWFAIFAEQALRESEAIDQHRLARSEAEQIATRELEARCNGRSVPFTTELKQRVLSRLLDERGYASGLARDFDQRVFPIDDFEVRESFWRHLLRREAR